MTWRQLMMTLHAASWSLASDLVVAPSCCAGTFVSEGRGGTYPPGPAGRAFNFVASNDNATRRFAQRSSVRARHLALATTNTPTVHTHREVSDVCAANVQLPGSNNGDGELVPPSCRR